MNKFYCLPNSGLNKSIVKNGGLQLFVYILCWIASFLIAIKLFNKIYWIIPATFLIDLLFCGILFVLILFIYTVQQKSYLKAFNDELNKVFKDYQINMDIITFVAKKDDFLDIYIYQDKIIRNNVVKYIDTLTPIEQVIYATTIVKFLKNYNCKTFLGNYFERDGEQKNTAVVIKANIIKNL